VIEHLTMLMHVDAAVHVVAAWLLLVSLLHQVKTKTVLVALQQLL
jgi:hypothetical protein